MRLHQEEVGSQEGGRRLAWGRQLPCLLAGWLQVSPACRNSVQLAGGGGGHAA